MWFKLNYVNLKILPTRFSIIDQIKLVCLMMREQCSIIGVMWYLKL